jgi:hypothetical protein
MAMINTPGYAFLFFWVLMIPAFQATAADKSMGTISGVISDANTGEVLEQVNVFLANTTIGDASDEAGTFTLAKIPPGVHNIIFSRVGYEMKTLTIEMETAKTITLDIKMKPKIVGGREIRIVAPDDWLWRRNFKKFKNIFLGETANSKQCTILNPYDLDFSTDSAGVFLAWSSEPLEIENLALGYRIKVYLNELTWGKNGGIFAYYPYYEELEKNENVRTEKYKKLREEIYSGSLRDFMAELAKGRYKKNKLRFTLFKIQNIGTSLKLSEKTVLHPSLLKILPLNNEMGTFRFWYNDNVLGVEDKQDKRLSMLIFMDKYIDFDANGNIINARQTGVDGYWATLRIADALPNDYHSDVNQ